MSDCIEWHRCRNQQGYGQWVFQGRQRQAHRVIFYFHHGYWPTVVRHTCDNPPCVNIEHLLPGTHADNNRDMVERGRQVCNLPTAINHGMPDQYEDKKAYDAEKYRRKRAGTWVYRKESV